MSLKMITPQVRRIKPMLRSPIKTVDPFYVSQEWRALARDMKRQRGYRCEACGEDFSTRQRRLIADHIIERKDGGADLDPLNIQCLCIGCHNAKTARVRRGRC